MKKHLSFPLPAVLLALSIVGCNPELILLKGSYVAAPTEINSSKPADSVWSNLKVLFDSHGLSIKKVDKETGLVKTRKGKFSSVYSFENDEGHLVEPQAWVVIHKTIVNKKLWYPHDIWSLWSIRVTEAGKGTTVTISPTVTCKYYPNPFTSMETQGQSTGTFEELFKKTLSGN